MFISFIKYGGYGPHPILTSFYSQNPLSENSLTKRIEISLEVHHQESRIFTHNNGFRYAYEIIVLSNFNLDSYEDLKNFNNWY